MLSSCGLSKYVTAGFYCNAVPFVVAAHIFCTPPTNVINGTILVSGGYLLIRYEGNTTIFCITTRNKLINFCYSGLGGQYGIPRFWRPSLQDICAIHASEPLLPISPIWSRFCWVFYNQDSVHSMCKISLTGKKEGSFIPNFMNECQMIEHYLCLLLLCICLCAFPYTSITEYTFTRHASTCISSFKILKDYN